MPNKLIFLSHIHEETEMALLLKTAIENEFAGFVEVFVSSDGTSIPAGTNFLKKIEEGLIECVGAIYLISPASVMRNWINFELGAVWIRGVGSERVGGPKIPTLPLCHSGCTPRNLPMPLNNLNAVQANQSSQLERAFHSIQSAVGGGGALRTDFDQLVLQVTSLERQYMLGVHLKEVLSLLTGDIEKLIQHCEEQPENSNATVQFGFIEQSIIDKLLGYAAGALKGDIEVKIDKPGLSMGPAGAINGAEISIIVPVSFVLMFKDMLRA